MKPGHLSAKLAGSLAICGIVALTACQGATPSPSPSASSTGERMGESLTSLFQQALEQGDLTATSREILERAAASGSIAEADYDELHARYETCMADSGYPEKWVKRPNGVFKYVEGPEIDFADDEEQEKYVAASQACAVDLAPIESLYATQQTNPDLLSDPFELAVACLIEGNFVDSTYTADSLRKELEAGFQNAPFDLENAAVKDCLLAGGLNIG